MTTLRVVWGHLCILLCTFWNRHNGRPRKDVAAPRKVEAQHAASLDKDDILRLAVGVGRAVEDASTARLAEVAGEDAACVPGPVVLCKLCLQVWCEGEERLGGEDGRGAKGRCRLATALNAVAVIDGGGFRGGSGH